VTGGREDGTTTPPRWPEPGRNEQNVQILLATSRDWLASALQAVLEHEGFEFSLVKTGQRALQDAPLVSPDVVIVDEGLPDISVPDLCRGMIEGGLRTSVPILVYSPSFWHESEQAKAIQAGAWDVIREPIRSRVLVSRLHRLLQVRNLIELADAAEASDSESRLSSFAGLLATLPVLTSVADRVEASLSCAMLGPTQPAADPGELAAQGRQVKELCERFTRTSDLCAPVGGADVAVVAFDADLEGLSLLVQRLSRQADASFSAGIVMLSPAPHGVGSATRSDERRASSERGPTVARIDNLSRLASAQNALSDVRASGGGILIAEQI